MEIKEEYLIFLSKEEIAAAAKKDDILITPPAQTTINAINDPSAIFAIYYTNPNITILKAELVTRDNFADFLKD